MVTCEQVHWFALPLVKPPPNPRNLTRNFRSPRTLQAEWQKKIRGVIYYFGQWAKRENGTLVRAADGGWKEAARRVQEGCRRSSRRANADDLQVKGTVRPVPAIRAAEGASGRNDARAFAEYKELTDMLVSQFGTNLLVDDLAADDFGQLHAVTAKKRDRFASATRSLARDRWSSSATKQD